MKINRRILILSLLALIAGTNLLNARTTHNEPNGFTWYEESELIDRSNNRRGDYNWAYDINGHDLFGRTYGIAFHCVDADDEGQFAVKQLFGTSDYREGLYSRDGKCILSPELGPVDFTKRFRSGGNYYFIAHKLESDYSSRYGIIDDKGKILVPFIYKRIDNTVHKGKRDLENCLYVEDKTGSEGIVRLDGSHIIKPEVNKHVYVKGPFIEASLPTPNSRTLMNYEGDILMSNASDIYDQPSCSRFKIKMPDGRVGFLGYDGKWILSPDLGYSDFLEFTDNSGKSYFKVKKNGLYGVLGSGRKAILPCEFEDIEYIGGNFFKFKSGDFWGVVTDLGKVIIPTSRGYDSIGKYSTIQKTIPFTKVGSRGECNSRGTVLSIHKAPPAPQKKETTRTAQQPSYKSTQSLVKASDYSEYTREFFAKPKVYSIKNFGVILLGPNGLREYKEGESTLTVTTSGFKDYFKDGSGSSYKITPPLKKVTVLTSHGDVEMQMYLLDNDEAVRAIRYRDGHCVVYIYVLNIATGKYVNTAWYTLRK